MTRVAIILAGMLLMLGGGATWASAEPQTAQTTASAANPYPLLDTTDSTPIDSVAINPDDSKATPVFGYAVSPKVTIDLYPRGVDVAETSVELFSDSFDVEQIAQNLMVGIRYSF